MHKVGQNRIYTPYMTVYLVISLLKILCKHRIYMVLANPMACCVLHYHGGHGCRQTFTQAGFWAFMCPHFGCVHILDVYASIL